ncbi:MAG: hypothetical protein EKK43_13750 [Methylobacterium sp.]|uniref:hypothetical protein n=1 Tax=Methylobacterium sp. TaxID=409 RepID=UPI000FA37FFC|nr:hypothetical protein [Methylobacterium sp.]RUP14042.1 MAG: hypothetical protein EKK43_13750 [Methylobacterium sp.]
MFTTKSGQHVRPALVWLQSSLMRAAPSTPERAGGERESAACRGAYEAVIPVLIQAMLEMRRLNEVIDRLVSSQDDLKGRLAASLMELAETKDALSRLSSGNGMTPDPDTSSDAA